MKTKKLIAMVLALVMVLGLAAFPVEAAGDADPIHLRPDRLLQEPSGGR